jgi:hypothetical protein
MATAPLWIGLQRQYHYGYTLGILSTSFYQRYGLQVCVKKELL